MEEALAFKIFKSYKWGSGDLNSLSSRSQELVGYSEMDHVILLI